MSRIVGHDDGSDLSSDRQAPVNYIPYENIDKSQYDIIHPENAMSSLGMSARTAYRKIDAGEMHYTLDKGSKRLVIKKSDKVSDQPKSMSDQPITLSETRQAISDISSDFADRLLSLTESNQKLTDRILSLSEEKDKIINERDQSIQILNNQLQAAQSALQKRNLPEVIDPKQKEIDALYRELEEARKQQRPFWKFWG